MNTVNTVVFLKPNSDMLAFRSVYLRAILVSL